MVVTQRHARLGQVGDDIGVAERRRGLQRSVRGRQLKVVHAVAVQIVANQIGELGRDAQLPSPPFELD